MQAAASTARTEHMAKGSWMQWVRLLAMRPKPINAFEPAAVSSPAFEPAAVSSPEFEPAADSSPEFEAAAVSLPEFKPAAVSPPERYPSCRHIERGLAFWGSS